MMQVSDGMKGSIHYGNNMSGAGGGSMGNMAQGN